jgi:hypothetical protein
MKETRVQPTKIDKDCYYYKHYSLDRMAGAWYLYDNDRQDWIADFYTFDEACEFLYELEHNDV